MLIELFELIDAKCDTYRTLKAGKEKRELKKEINSLMQQAEKIANRKIYNKI